MADNSLDDLEEEADRRRRRRSGGGGRKAGEPRFPRKPDAGGGPAKRLEEREKARLERERRRLEEEEPLPPPPESELEQASAPSPEPPRAEGGEGMAGKKRKRPSSMPFYPNPEHEAFLWRVTEAASARQKRIPATAVLRLALTRLEQQMTPSEIVQVLGNVEQPEGKMGRPRL